MTDNLTPSFINAMADWSRTTLGEGEHLETVLAHVLKEVEEIRRTPKDIEEWADLIILAIDGATRQGYDGLQVVEAVRTKVAKNRRRKWPAPGTVPEGQPIEHVRERSAPLPHDAAIGPRTSNVDSNGILAQGRVEVLAEDPAGGHAIGAPATREEERSLAREVLRFRTLAAGAQIAGVQWIEPGPPRPAGVLIAVPWLVRRADTDPVGRWYGVPAESSACAAEIFAAEVCGPPPAPRTDRQWEVLVEVADSPMGPLRRYLVRCAARLEYTAERA